MGIMVCSLLLGNAGFISSAAVMKAPVMERRRPKIFRG